jgi:nucleotide-binding universal stress UspA family protein
VVVGVDGSDASRTALRAALGEATLAGTGVEAVAAFSLGHSWYEAYPVAPPAVAQVGAEVRARVGALVRDVAGDGSRAPQVRVRVVRGRPTDVLVEAAQDAVLLVVGSHGHGAVRGLLLGSVALGCALAADCPVMVVRPRPADPDLAEGPVTGRRGGRPPGAAHRARSAGR